MVNYKCYLCGNSPNKEKKISLHKFPDKKENLLIEWLQECRLSRNDDVTGLRLCSDHFNEKCISKGLLKNKLDPSAIPSINTRRSKGKRKSKSHDTLNSTHLADHKITLSEVHFVEVKENIPYDTEKLQSNPVKNLPTQSENSEFSNNSTDVKLHSDCLETCTCQDSTLPIPLPLITGIQTLSNEAQSECITEHIIKGRDDLQKHISSLQGFIDAGISCCTVTFPIMHYNQKEKENMHNRLDKIFLDRGEPFTLSCKIEKLPLRNIFNANSVKSEQTTNIQNVEEMSETLASKNCIYSANSVKSEFSEEQTVIQNVEEMSETLAPKNCIFSDNSVKSEFSEEQTVIQNVETETLASTNFDLELETSTSIPSEKRRFAEPRYVSEIQIQDIATPRQANRIIKFVKAEDKKKSEKIKKLNTAKWRLQKKILRLQDILSDLREQGMISSDAEDTIMVTFRATADTRKLLISARSPLETENENTNLQ